MYILGFVLGTVLGSFVKALADRSLNNRSFWGRSYCLHCKKLLQWYDLFPIFSYLLGGGRCRYCGNRISLEYLVVEVIMGVLVGFLFWSFDFARLWRGFALDKLFIFLPDLIFQTFFITILAALFLTDLKKMLIPDRIILPAIVISTIYLIVITVYKIGYLYYYLLQTHLGRLLLPPNSDYFQRHAIMTAEPFFYAVLSAILIGGFFYFLILITKGRGMGGGDVKLGGLIGIGLGFPNAIVALMLAFLSGAIVSLVLILSGKKHFGQHIAFGPFLVIGALITLFWGDRIFNWYLHLSF